MGMGYVNTIIHGQLHSEPVIVEVEDVGEVIKFELLTRFEDAYRIVDVMLNVSLPKDEMHNMSVEKDIFLAGELDCFMDVNDNGHVFTHYEMDAKYIAYDIYHYNDE